VNVSGKVLREGRTFAGPGKKKERVLKKRTNQGRGKSAEIVLAPGAGRGSYKARFSYLWGQATFNRGKRAWGGSRGRGEGSTSRRDHFFARRKARGGVILAEGGKRIGELIVAGESDRRVRRSTVVLVLSGRKEESGKAVALGRKKGKSRAGNSRNEGKGKKRFSARGNGATTILILGSKRRRGVAALKRTAARRREKEKGKI